jgi:hypothetical protein
MIDALALPKMRSLSRASSQRKIEASLRGTKQSINIAF